MFCHFVLTTKTTQRRPQVFSVICPIIWQFCFTSDVSFHISQNSSKFGGQHPRRPRGSQSRREKRRDESFQVRAKKPLAELLPKIPADAGSWLGTKYALYYCAQSPNSFSWDLFVSSYTTAIVSITACLAHAPNKCKQSGNFLFDIKSPSDLKILSARKLKTLFQKYKLELTTGIHACIGHVLRKY